MTLLNRIERYLERSGTTATRFGRDVMSDPAFVRDLRNGRHPSPQTEARILAAIEAGDRAREQG